MIYIVSHKHVEPPRVKGYRPIQVGFAPESYPGFLRDNTGDNIADKNGGYCELTAMYWVWRNTDDLYKGLAHYRRYFGRRPFSSDPADILDIDALTDLLDGVDIVVPKPAVYHVNARDQLLMECCTRPVFDCMEATVAEMQPGYVDAFQTFFRGNRASQYNMLFCRRELFDAWCAWLFPLLFALEEQVDLTGANDYQKRLFGFLSERLLNVWIAGNSLRARHVPVVSTEYTRRDHFTYFRRDITNGLRFRLGGGK